MIRSVLPVSLLAAVVMGGCEAKGTPQPSNITFESALVSVANGLKEMKKAEGDMRTGLIASEVEVTFNVTASTNDGSKLVVDVGAKPPEPVPIEASASAERTSSTTSSRGNQIKIKFANFLYAKNNDLVFAKSPEEVAKLLDVLRVKDITYAK